MKRHGNAKFDTAKEISLNSIINRYIQKAKIRKLNWKLSDKNAKKLLLQNCFYCGSEPKNKHNVYIAKNGNFKVNREDWANSAWISYNGIDRRNNSKGYTKTNSVSCCTFCNYAKHNKTEKEFIEWLDQVVNFRKNL